MKAALLAVVALAFSVNPAFAVSLAVKLACADDYYTHCSMHAPDSPGVRKCMRAVGRNLSARCIGALRDAGLVKQTRVASAKAAAAAKRYAAKRPAAKAYAAARTSASKKHYASKAQRKVYASKSAARKQYASKRDLQQRGKAGKAYARRAQRPYTRIAERY